MTPVGFLPEARDDIDEAYTEYERLRTGLGDDFLDALQRVFGLIEHSPQLYGEVARRVRAAMPRRFPFVVYYKIESAQVLVIAVRHGRDDPAIWRARV